MSLLRVRAKTDITTLGAHTLRITISMLIFAALLLTLTLWLILKGMLLLPIEHLTTILRGEDPDKNGGNGEVHLLSTVNRLSESRGSIAQRNDEIGELINAFNDLTSSLLDATNSV
ncbi:MAG: hypothetical protein AB8B87_23490 [Granulosicoccus sp.]